MKNFPASDLVGALARSEPCFVNAIVYVVVNEVGKHRVPGFDLFWEKVDSFVSGKLVKHIVEHAADVVLGVVHDSPRLPVPQDGDGEAAAKVRGRDAVRFAQKFEAVTLFNNL